MTRTAIADRAPAATVTKARRIVMLRASWETQEKLREWAKVQGFDLAWAHSGWPQTSWSFDFHVTVVASENEVKLADGFYPIDPLTLVPSGYEVLGVDREIPTLAIEANATLSAIREFFITTHGMKPTFPDFKPHVSLSYKWNGEPPVVEMAPALPDFPLVFDALMVAIIDDEPKAKTTDVAASKVFAMADKATISGTRKTADGYLVTDARVARGGNIQEYFGHEFGDRDDPNRVVKVYRPEDEIFKRSSLSTFAHKPVTMDHPAEGVTPETFRRDAVGHVGSDVVRDGEFVRVPLVIMDKAAIDAIEGGKREISMGYDCELVMDAGTTPDGRAYDAYQKNIRINHCAIVAAGRAGHACRVGDSLVRAKQLGAKPMTKTVTIDGKPFDVADEVAAAFEAAKAAQAKVADTTKAASDVLDAAQKAVADMKAELAEAKKAVPTADQIGAMVAELADTREAAKAVAPTLDTRGLNTAAAIKAAAVKAALGDEAVKDRSADYLSAAFDMLAARKADVDPFADNLRNAQPVQDAAAAARTKHFDEQAKAWQH